MCLRGLLFVMLLGLAASMSIAVGDDDSETSLLIGMDEVPGALLFGSSLDNSNHLACTFFDLTRARNGKRIPMDQAALNDSLLKFMQEGWKLSRLARYYRSPLKRYATAVMIPPVESRVAPAAFGEMDTTGRYWLLLYEGTLVHPEGLTFRFRGAAEDGIMVRVGDRVVFGDQMLASEKGLAEEFSKVWKSSDKQTGKFYLGNSPATVGDWITLEPGVPVEISIVVAESSGGMSSAMLLVEENGVQYPENQQGGPMLPIFKMGALPLELMDQVCMRLPAGEVALEGGPIFNESAEVSSPADTALQDNLEMMDESSGSGLRIWTGDNGSVLEARIEGVSGNMVVLKDAAGKKRRIPIDRLSKADQRYIELAHNQEHSIVFEARKCLLKNIQMQNLYPVKQKKKYEYFFEATAKQIRSARRTHDLMGELYVLTRELKGDACILLAREERSFISLRNAGLSFVISTKPVTVIDEAFSDASRKEDDFIYLFIIKDADGIVMNHSASEPWLFPNLGNLQQQPVGAFIDQSCNRVRPSRPESEHY